MRQRQPRPKRHAVVKLLAVVAVLATAILIPSPGDAQAPIKAPNWKSCYPEVTAQFSFLPPEIGGAPVYECATVKVPLDYDTNRGGKISIDLVRLVATDSDNKVGSMFVNPGGPGGSGIEFTLFGAPFLFGPEVRSNFDIVGFDPRGVTRGSPLKCFGNIRQATAGSLPISFPVTEAEVQAYVESSAIVADQCEKRGNRLLGHMSTANVARDLDYLRQAVGDEQLTYYGISYGSMIGTTYANLFPDNVRAVVIDAVLDPIAWTAGGPGEQDVPSSTRLRSAEGAQDSLEEFFRLCDAAGPGCAFAPDSAVRFEAIATTLLDQGTVPLVLDIGPGQVTTEPFHYSNLIGFTLGPMYASGTWSQLAADLATIEDQLFNGGTTPLVLPQGGPPEVKNLFPHYNNFVEAFPAVFCADSDNPMTTDAWVAAAGAPSPDDYFRPLWTWVSNVCQTFDGAADADRYTGPWNAQTANPVLVMTTTFDPATPIHGAELVDSLLPNSALLVVDGWAHGTLGISGCAAFFRDAYIVNGTLPPPGLRCPQDVPPF